MNTYSQPIFSLLRWFLTFISILFVWSLPILGELGFAESSGNSISDYIANPHATGAMAFISFIPLLTICEYQDYYLNSKVTGVLQQIVLYWSLRMFVFFYGMFIIITVNYNQTLHSMAVVLFGISFIIHGILSMLHITKSYISIFTISVGIVSFISLQFIGQNILYWCVECIGFTAMVLFTPIEIMSAV